MKRVFVALVTIAMCLCLFGCAYKTDNSYRMTPNLEPISTKEDLYYDVQTKVVYIMFGHTNGGYRGYGYMSAYYAPNGLPYLYDVNSQTLVEVEPNW